MADASHSDRARLVRFWTSARGFWRGKSGMIAWPLTVGLVVIAVFQLAVQYRLNYWNRDFFNALARHDGDRTGGPAVVVPAGPLAGQPGEQPRLEAAGGR